MMLCTLGTPFQLRHSARRCRERDASTLPLLFKRTATCRRLWRQP